jgi:NAD(P)-dependent dehydrogenase (short-subunit alcohol dehydrogenase family)
LLVIPAKAGIQFLRRYKLDPGLRRDDEQTKIQRRRIPMNLEGRRVAVTGAFGSLGLATVAALDAAGARVAAIDRSDAPPQPFSQANVHAIGGVDIGDAKAAEDTIARSVAALGGLDALVNIAGTFRWEKVEGGSLDTWDLLYRVNVRTAVAASRAAIPYLVKSGNARIVNIGAMGALKAGAGMGAYAASKSGVAKLTEALAEELKDKGVTVNAVLPSIIDTPPNRADMPNAEFDRWVKPAEIAGVIAFLVSDDACAITGTLIPIAGRV